MRNVMKPTRCIFGRSFSIALIISLLLPFGLAHSGVIVQDTAGNQLTGVDISGKTTIAPMLLGAHSLDADWSYWDAGSMKWQPADSLSYSQPKPDSTTHYVDRLDTTYQRDRIICDTIFIELDPDSTGHKRYRIRRDCDTVYVQRIIPHWARLEAPLLRPDQIAELMRLLALKDSSPSWTR